MNRHLPVSKARSATDAILLPQTKSSEVTDRWGVSLIFPVRVKDANKI